MEIDGIESNGPDWEYPVDKAAIGETRNPLLDVMQGILERGTGVEPVSQAWEAWARPIYQPRSEQPYSL